MKKNNLQVFISEKNQKNCQNQIGKIKNTNINILYLLKKIVKILQLDKLIARKIYLQRQIKTLIRF